VSAPRAAEEDESEELESDDDFDDESELEDDPHALREKIRAADAIVAPTAERR
jgi:NAD(P)H-dependent FMN reductase